MAVWNLKNFDTLKFLDGTGTPIEVTLGPGDRQLQVDGLQENFTEGVVVMDGGDFYERVEGEQQAVTFSLTVKQDGKLIDASSGKPLNAVLKKGTLSSGVTVDPGGVVWAGTIEISGSRAGVSVTITINNVRVTASFALNIGGNELSLSGEAWGDPATSLDPFVVS